MVKAGLPMSDRKPKITSMRYYDRPAGWQYPVAGMDMVMDMRTDESCLVLDVREAYRYNGESEPIDLIAGHIPGAFNLPYVNNLDDEGKFLSPDNLSTRYAAVIGNRDPDRVVVHCGSGVTACHTLLAMEIAGIRGARLYVGSWSEWSRNDKPIATGCAPGGS
jgi:thiosulfate/3-mercaptopyruvate sulfurtransferase